MLSKVDAIKEKILNEIKSGRFKAESIIPSRHQLMKKYSCARGSIDTAINDLTKTGVLYSRQGKGTFVAPQKAAAGITRIFIAGDYSQEHRDESWRSTPLAAEIQQMLPCSYIHRNDININLQNITHPGNAVIWVRPSYSELRIMDYLDAAGIPQLLIGRNFGNYDHVRTDAESGIGTGLEWLSEKGGREIIYIAEQNNPDTPYIAERQLAFYSKSIQLGMELKAENIFIKDFNISRMGPAIGAIAEDLLSRKKFPKAVFISSISAATPFVIFLDAKGKVPGKDYHLLTFDQDIWLLEREGIGMIRQEWAAMDEVAIEWVKQKMEGAKEKFQRKIKPEFIVKD